MKLVIAEKPSVAMALAQVVGATARKEGYVEGNGYLVSWCVGHLVRLCDACLLYTSRIRKVMEKKKIRIFGTRQNAFCTQH